MGSSIVIQINKWLWHIKNDLFLLLQHGNYDTLYKKFLKMLM